MELLKVAWEGFPTPAEHLVGILQAAGLLCPVHSPAASSDETVAHETPEAQLTSTPIKSDNPDGPSSTSVGGFVVPFHLRERNLEKRWQRSCKKWKGICASDKVLIFDFQDFLPPALFNYLLVRTTEESEKTNGMQPIMARDMGIFSFGCKFFLFLTRLAKHNQIQVNIRWAPDVLFFKNPECIHILLSIISVIVFIAQICSNSRDSIEMSKYPQ